MNLKNFDQVIFNLFVVSLALLVFLTGNLSAQFNWFPNAYIKDAIAAARAWREREQTIEKGAKEAGEIQYNASKAVRKAGAYEGYTLFATEKKPVALLIDMDGNVVHRWEKKFSEVWPEPFQIAHPLPDVQIYWRDARAYPNGDLLAVYEARGDTPYGYGLVKLDKDSNVIWRYDAKVHHQFDIAPNGDIYVLTHDFSEVSPEERQYFGALEGNLILEDSLVVLTPEGKEITRFSLMQTMMASPYRSFLKDHMQDAREKSYDALHANSVQVLTPEMQKAFPQFKAGQVLVSMRNIGAVAVVDVGSRSVVWAATGEWKMQHDADFIADGTIMLFDNQGIGERRSRILKFDPQTRQTAVVYERTTPYPFFSPFYGEQQVLPNGNLLITAGRMLEVNKEQDIVWQFWNPYHIGRQRMRIMTGRRYAADALPFLKP